MFLLFTALLYDMPVCTNIRQYHGKGVQVVEGQKEKNVFHVYLFLPKKNRET
jgi:hypothetical protein